MRTQRITPGRAAPYLAHAAAVVVVSGALMAAATIRAAASGSRPPDGSAGASAPRTPKPAAQRVAPPAGAGSDAALRDRIQHGAPGRDSSGTMRFGDTEVRIGGRAGFGYDYSGR